MSAYYQHCNTDMCPPASYYGRHTIACGCGCPKCVPHDPVTRIATLERELAAVTAERDALLAGRWAGPWQWVEGVFCQRLRPGDKDGDPHIAEVVLRGHEFWWRVGFTAGCRGSDGTIEAAKADADAALVRAGWYLAPTPPTGTPGDGTR